MNVYEYERHPTLKLMQSMSRALEELLASSRRYCPLKENASLTSHQSSISHVSGLYETKQPTVLCQSSVAPFYVYEVHSCPFSIAIAMYEYITTFRINFIRRF